MGQEILDGQPSRQLRSPRIILVENLLLGANGLGVAYIIYMLYNLTKEEEGVSIVITIVALVVSFLVIAYPVGYILKWRQCVLEYEKSYNIELLKESDIEPVGCFLYPATFLWSVLLLANLWGSFTIAVNENITLEKALFIISLAILFFILGPIQFVFFRYLNKIRLEAIASS